jgi:CHAT domain
LSKPPLDLIFESVSNHLEKLMSRSIIKTILLLTANPKGTAPLRLDQEVRDIREGLQRSQHRDAFRIEQRWAVRPRDVQRAMLDLNPQIVHFSGHGEGEEGLKFEDESGKVKFVDAEALAELFELFADQVECVVLNACYSEVQAEAIYQHIPSVIGMKKAIGDRAALEFAVGFYDAIGAGRSIEFAYKLGCSAIRMAGMPENLTPALKQKMPSLSSASSFSSQAAASALSTSQKRRLEQKRDIFQSELDIRSEKLHQFRESLAIEAGAAVKFQLQKQIQDEETQLTNLKGQIEAIENHLA